MDYEVKADAIGDTFEQVVMKPERPVLAVEPTFEAKAFDGFLRRGDGDQELYRGDEQRWRFCRAARD
jgi:hypothetical protein